MNCLAASRRCIKFIKTINCIANCGEFNPQCGIKYNFSGSVHELEKQDKQLEEIYSLMHYLKLSVVNRLLIEY